MKAKEKLAREWQTNEVDRVAKQPVLDAYVAGFEKAREMAAHIHEACGAASGCCADKIEQLGEDEDGG